MFRAMWSVSWFHAYRSRKSGSRRVPNMVRFSNLGKNLTNRLNYKYNSLTLTLGVSRFSIIILNETNNAFPPIYDHRGSELIILESSLMYFSPQFIGTLIFHLRENDGNIYQRCQRLLACIYDPGLILNRLNNFNSIPQYRSYLFDNFLKNIKNITVYLSDREGSSANMPRNSPGDSGGSFDSSDSSSDSQSQNNSSNNPSDNINNNPDSENSNNSENENNQNEPSTPEQNPVELDDENNQNEPRTPKPNPDYVPEDHTRAPKKPTSVQPPSDHTIAPPTFELSRPSSPESSNTAYSEGSSTAYSESSNSVNSESSDTQNLTSSNALGLIFDGGDDPTRNINRPTVSNPNFSDLQLNDDYNNDLDFYSWRYLSPIEEVTENSSSDSSPYSSWSSSSSSSSSLSTNPSPSPNPNPSLNANLNLSFNASPDTGSVPGLSSGSSSSSNASLSSGTSSS